MDEELAGDYSQLPEMKKLLYVCEADSGGILEYAIRQSAAIAQEGVEVHFLCKPSFPVERLADGIKVWEFEKSRESRVESRGLLGKILRVLGMISDLRSEAKQVAELATKLTHSSSTRHPLPATRYSVEDVSQIPVTRHRPGSAEVAILFACYKEYFAPFWVEPLRGLARRGVVIGTIAHDPVRDFVVGPLWWHRWSVRLGYSFVQHVFVHDDTPVDFGGKRPDGIEVHQIPHGPYEVSDPKIGRIEMRKRLSFSLDLTTEDTTERLGGREMEQPKVGPKGEGVGTTESKISDVEAGPCLDKLSCASESDSLTSKLADSPVSEALDAGRWTLDVSALADVVFLAFGQIRDGKNLDLFLQAMTRLPENVKLLVAGKGDSGSSRSAEFYQKLAEELGVAERCRWDMRRIPDEEVGDIFAVCDVVLVTYSAKFRSASGVLNAAVSARKPLLASSGSGPLKTVVEKYQLGVFVEPDDAEEILRGASKLLPSSATGKCEFVLQPDWDKYEQENSWEENARWIYKAFEM